MQLNGLIFPAPIASYSYKYNSELLWIPKPVPTPILPPAKIQKSSLFSSSLHFKKLNITIPLDKSSSSPLQSVELSSTAPFKHNEISNPTPLIPLKIDEITTPSKGGFFRREGSPVSRKVKDFGSHNNLFSMRMASVTPISTKSENRKTTFLKNNSSTPTLSSNSSAIPCLYYEHPTGSNLILLHFHANAEDIGDCFQYMKILGNALKVNCLLVEYPGYGIYKGKCSSEKILKDSEIVLEFLIHEINVPLKNILLFGRSVGTGPATHLASKYEVGGLILVSPYTSMKRLVGDHYGRLAGWLIAERFENIKQMENVKCPTLFIHGEKDELIPVRHSLELQQKMKEGVFSELYSSKDMTHNKLDIINDLIKPIAKFMIKTDIWFMNKSKNFDDKINFPLHLKKPPSNDNFRKGKSFINFFFTNKKSRVKKL